MSSLLKAKAGDAAIGRDELVLLADRLAQSIDLDMAGLLRELPRADDASLVGVKRAQQRRREAAGRPEPGAGRDIGQLVISILSVTPVNRQGLAHDWMLDIFASSSTCSSCEYLR